MRPAPAGVAGLLGVTRGVAVNNSGTRTAYRVVRECLINDWRGLGWHTNLAKRWGARQRILRPDTPGKDRNLLAHTEHGSMLPEAVAVVTVLANDHHHATALTMTSQRHLTRPLGSALHLDSYWSTGTGDQFDAHHTLTPMHRHLAEQTRFEWPTKTRPGHHNPVFKTAERRA